MLLTLLTPPWRIREVQAGCQGFITPLALPKLLFSSSFPSAEHKTSVPLWRRWLQKGC